MTNYHTVIWDWNGTLLDDVHLALRIANDIFAENGVARITREHYTRIFDFPVKEYYERAGLFLSDSQYEEISERFCDEFEADLATVRLFPSVQAVLSAVGQSGLQQYILSGTEHPRLARMLDSFEISGHFDGFKGMSDGLAHGKITAACELLNEFELEAAGTVVVGDTSHDHGVAQAMGLDCLLLATGHQSFERLSKLDCPVFHSLAELQNHLLRQAG
ncbi:MAG: HAD family hydrolase [bacterium]